MCVPWRQGALSLNSVWIVGLSAAEHLRLDLGRSLLYCHWFLMDCAYLIAILAADCCLFQMCPPGTDSSRVRATLSQRSSLVVASVMAPRTWELLDRSMSRAIVSQHYS